MKEVYPFELMTTVSRLPEVNAGGKWFEFGLGELYHELKKPVPAVFNTAIAGVKCLAPGTLLIR
jgi:hypothetical protein